MLTAPGAEAGVLGIRTGIRNLPRVVPSLGRENAGHGVALAEVHEVSEAAERGGLLRRHAPSAVVVQHVPQDLRVVRSTLERLPDDLLAEPANRADGGRVPDRSQPTGLEIV